MGRVDGGKVNVLTRGGLSSSRETGNLYREVQLRGQESAEAIVLLMEEEGPNMRPRARSYEFERKTKKAENSGWRLS